MYILTVVAFIISFSGTYFLIGFLARKNVLDIPKIRSNHDVAIPRGAGIAVISSLVISILIWGSRYHVDLYLLLSLVIPIILLSGISFLDDKKHVSPVIRIFVQLIAVVIALTYMPHTTSFTHMIHHILSEIMDVNIPNCYLENIYLEYAIVIFWWLWCINLYNFMDGINGITATQTICMMTGFICIGRIHLGIWIYEDITIFIIASMLGFLPFNIYKARIFLGDVGSIPLGFLFGYLFIVYAEEQLIVPIVAISSYYILDSSYTLLYRIMRGEKFWLPHTMHFFQQAVRNGQTHFEVVVKLIFNAIVNNTCAILDYVYASHWYLLGVLLSNLCIIYNFTCKKRI